MANKQRPDLAIERGLPANLDAERFCLGAVLMDDANFSVLRDSLETEDFAIEKHRRIFLRMTDINKRGERIDRVTVANELQSHGQLESVDGVTYLCSLDEGLPVLANLESYVRIVRERSLLRRGALLASRLAEQFIGSGDEPGAILGEAERLIRELGQRAHSRGNLATAAEIIGEMDLNSLGTKPADCIRTPYARLNSQIVGFRPGELIVIGGRPSSGKSTAVLEMALAAAETGLETIYFSLEMQREAIIIRGGCNRGQVDNMRVRRGELNATERYALLQAMNAIAKLPLAIDDSAHSFGAMAREVRKMPTAPRLMIVDHLHLMEVSGRHDTRNLELSSITRSFKLFAGEINIPVILLAQLNRASEKESRPPALQDLRDCGSIEADADIVLLLHKKEQLGDPSGKAPVPVDLILAKQRDGVSMLRMPMHLMGKYFKFYEEDTRESERDGAVRR